MVWQYGILVGGERERNAQEAITPSEYNELSNNISLTDTFIDMVLSECRNGREDLETEVKVWRLRFNELKEKESNDDGNDHSKCDCSLCY